MSDCEVVRARALEAGPDTAAGAADLREHISHCDECQRFLADLQRLDGALSDLPAIDAPEALVKATETRLRQASRPPPRRRWRPKLWFSMAAGIALVAIVVGLIQPAYQTLSTGYYRDNLPSVEVAPAPAEVPAPSPRVRKGRAGGARKELGAGERQFAQLNESLRHLSRDYENKRAPEPLPKFDSGAEKSDGLGQLRQDKKQKPKRELEERSEAKLLAGLSSGSFQGGLDADQLALIESKSLERGDDRTFGDRLRRMEAAQSPAAPSEDAPARPRKSLDPVLSSSTESFGAVEGNGVAKSAAPNNAPRAVKRNSKSELARRGAKPGRLAEFPRNHASGTLAASKEARPGAGAGRASAAARAFLAGLETVDDLVFKDATGYWRNTYIPGDSAMRLLRTRLSLLSRIPQVGDARLAGTVRTNHQPLDPPGNAAMALYLQADKAAISGTQRLRIQVGLQGALRTGSRPTMNVSLVVDRTTTGQPSAAQVRAIVSALASARQPGDRISLTVAGKDGGTRVDAGDFRHGPLQVALARMFDRNPVPGAQPMGLPDALRIATRVARGGTDPSAVLGSSLVLLVTGGVAEEMLGDLQDMAHRNALRGTILSVVDTSSDGVLGSTSAALERLVAAGQGHRRSMPSANEAKRIVDAELHAASRAVARAARLRIRLSPGVQLLDVLGSRRLDVRQSERVREAEQSIDQRLARNLGIKADRGQDEDGIQIVIPNFYAGDSHVILLDVLTSGPGPIADVTLRYKDLVQLKNGVARAQLSLPSGDRGPGPLQRNVLKNRVAIELARAAHSASDHLARGDAQRAIETLRSIHDLLSGLRDTVGGWSSDRELIADAHLVADYIEYLQSGPQSHPIHQRYAVESLRYVAFRKLTRIDEESP